MKSVQTGSWRALNETAKIMKNCENHENREISQGRRRNRRRNTNGFVESPQRNCENLRKLQKLRESQKIVNFAEEFNPGNK